MEDKRTQWHPAFCSAMKLELMENKNDLTFSSEHGLNTKPILIDLLVITKSPDVVIKNEIGEVFKGHNIFEYKSPNDELNIDTLYKTFAYACLYKAGATTVDGIKADDITVSIVREKKPKKLMKELITLGYVLDNKCPGIYVIKNRLPFVVQILVTGELNEESHVWLTSLTQNISEESARSILLISNRLSLKDDKENADSVLQVAVQKNPDVFNKLKEVDKGMCEALKELMKPELDEAVKKAEKNAEERTLIRLVKEGLLSAQDAAKQLKISEKAFKAKLN